MKFKKIVICLSCLSIFVINGCSSDNSKTVNKYVVSSNNDSSIVNGLNDDAYILSDNYTHIMTDSILTSSRDVSISLWINPSSNFNWTTILSLGKDENHFFQLSSSGNPDGVTTGLTFSIRNGNDIQRVLTDENETLKVGVLNQVVITMGKGILTIYLNGIAIGTKKLENIIKNLNCDRLIIGKSELFDDPQATGVFQDLSIYNYALNGNEVANLYDDLYPLTVLSAIDFGNTSDITENIQIPEIKEFNVSWTSSDDNIINSLGEVNIPEELTDDKEIVLNASIEYNEKKYSKNFSFWILADSDATRIKRSKLYLENETGYFLNNNQKLISSIDKYNTKISWSIVIGEADIIDNHLIKQTDDEKTPITLRATITSNDISDELLVNGMLLDEYVEYIMSYFNGTYEKETGKLAYSYDGLNWNPLNHCKSIITSNLGTERVRDPYIGRDKNGNFVILATQGWDNKEIFVWFSNDLVSFTENKLLSISVKDHYLNITGERAWAPEFYYDANNDEYIIYFSDPRGTDDSTGTTYYVSTSDFNSVSYMNSLFDTEYPIIDGTFTVLDGEYWEFFKDNYAQTVFMASTKSILDHKWKVFDDDFIFKKRNIEGPFVVKVSDNNYYLYVDQYKEEKFYVAKYSILGYQNDITWLDADQYKLPENDVRHGSVIAVTKKELDRLLKAYGD